MTLLLPKWTKLPNGWIEKGGLKEFRWLHRKGANDLAGLMSLAAIAHHIDDDGISQLTYDDFQRITGLSRAKVSAGLGVLKAHKLIEVEPLGRGSYRLASYHPKSGWAKFPARGLYRHGSIAAFEQFKLRQPAELDASKLYFLFASRRDREKNMAQIGYDKIEAYSGVGRSNIKRALSVLAAGSLVHIEHLHSAQSDNGVSNGYRLTHLDSHRHMGTSGRSDESWHFSDEDV